MCLVSGVLSENLILVEFTLRNDRASANELYVRDRWTHQSMGPGEQIVLDCWL